MKKLIVLLLLLILFVPYHFAYAESVYVLPYPSFMPGSKIYAIHTRWEALMRFWHFGNFAQIDYNLHQSDKYLVEAKTLFEYKQYLLAVRSLEKSNSYFLQVPLYLDRAKKEKKDVSKKSALFKQASLKHDEVLNRVYLEAPETFNWQPEKKASSFLNLHEIINRAVAIRKQYE